MYKYKNKVEIDSIETNDTCINDMCNSCFPPPSLPSSYSRFILFCFLITFWFMYCLPSPLQVTGCDSDNK